MSLNRVQWTHLIQFGKLLFMILVRFLINPEGYVECLGVEVICGKPTG